MVREGGLDYTDKTVQQKLCGGLGCNDDSLVTQIYLASKNKKRSYIASTPASWIDDYLDWLRIEKCCKFDPNTQEFCPAIDPSKNENILLISVHAINLIALQIPSCAMIARKVTSTKINCGLMKRRSISGSLFSLRTILVRIVPKEATQLTDR